MIGHAAAWYSWANWPTFNRDLVVGGARSHRPYGMYDVDVAREEPWCSIKTPIDYRDAS